MLCYRLPERIGKEFEKALPNDPAGTGSHSGAVVTRRLDNRFGSGTPPLHFIQKFATDAFDSFVNHPGKGFFPGNIVA